MGKVTKADIVRGLVSQRALTRAELLAISGLSPREVRTATNELVRQGMLVLEGEAYRLGRPKVVRTRRTPEQERERQKVWRRTRGMKPRAEYLAERKAAAEANAEAVKQRRAERQRAKRAAEAAARPAKEPKPVKVKPPKPSERIRTINHQNVQASIARQFLKPEPVDVPAETVEQFLARSGQIQRIPAAWERNNELSTTTRT